MLNLRPLKRLALYFGILVLVGFGWSFLAMSGASDTTMYVVGGLSGSLFAGLAILMGNVSTP